LVKINTKSLQNRKNGKGILRKQGDAADLAAIGP